MLVVEVAVVVFIKYGLVVNQHFFWLIYVTCKTLLIQECRTRTIPFLRLFFFLVIGWALLGQSLGILSRWQRGTASRRAMQFSRQKVLNLIFKKFIVLGPFCLRSPKIMRFEERRFIFKTIWSLAVKVIELDFLFHVELNVWRRLDLRETLLVFVVYEIVVIWQIVFFFLTPIISFLVLFHDSQWL